MNRWWPRLREFWGALVGGLVILLVVQVSYKWPQPGPPSSGPALGKTAVAEVTVVSNNQQPRSLLSLVPRASCAVVVVASTYCAVCARMRYVWRQRLASVASARNVGIAAVWLFSQDSTEVGKFTEQGDWKHIIVARLPSPDVLEEIGIIGTPTTYLLDRHGKLRLGLLGDQLPPADSLVSACS